MPLGPGVRMISAPKALSSTRRSRLMVSGMVRMSLYPLTAATKARAMPVLPLVGSIRIVWPGLILPDFSASSIMARPMRSLTLASGFWLSSLATTVAGSPAATRLSRTRGVCPISSVTFAAIRAMIDLLVRACFPTRALDQLGLNGGAFTSERFARESRRTPGIGARTRAVSATSTHKNSLDPQGGMWQA